MGAVAVCKNLSDVLAWWIHDFQGAIIKGAGLKPSLIKALGLVRSDDDSWEEGSVRINGRMWRPKSVSADP